MIYSTVVRLEDEKINPEDLKKFILCDIQIKLYPQIEKTFLEILKLSGFPSLHMNGKIDFYKLYMERKNQKKFLLKSFFKNSLCFFNSSLEGIIIFFE